MILNLQCPMARVHGSFVERNNPIHENGCGKFGQASLSHFGGGGLLTALSHKHRDLSISCKIALLLSSFFCLFFYSFQKHCQDPAFSVQVAITLFVGHAGFRRPPCLHCLEYWHLNPHFCRLRVVKCP